MKLMCFDVGGTDIKYSVIDQDLNLAHKGKTPTPYETSDFFVETLFSIFEPFRDEVDGVALSLPGFVNTDTGYIMGGGPHFLRNVNMHEKIQNRLGKPVSMENDGKCAALCELKHPEGALNGVKNGAVFIMGTGVGGGLVINGELLKGRNNTAGEFSFMNVDIDTTRGIDGMMYSRCSTRILLKKYEEASGEKINGIEFFARLENDEKAREVLKSFCQDVAVEIMNLGILLNVDRVAIGGGISQQPALLEYIKEAIDSNGMNRHLAKEGYNPFIPEVCTCRFYNDANLLGAYYSWIEAHKK